MILLEQGIDERHVSSSSSLIRCDYVRRRVCSFVASASSSAVSVVYCQKFEIIYLLHFVTGGFGTGNVVFDSSLRASKVYKYYVIFSAKYAYFFAMFCVFRFTARGTFAVVGLRETEDFYKCDIIHIIMQV
jgi:hypothetical protein